MASAAMTDPATGIAFAPRLQDEREIVGVGVRKKGPIKVGLCIARFMYMCEHGSLFHRADMNPNVTGVFLGFLSTTQLVANQNHDLEHDGVLLQKTPSNIKQTYEHVHRFTALACMHLMRSRNPCLPFPKRWTTRRARRPWWHCVKVPEHPIRHSC